MDQNSGKRKYDSTRRKAQARQTRLQILESARRLFYERGYEKATIDLIARDAGVAPETVYAVFGNKLAILKQLVDITVVGDDLPVPLLQRPHILSAAEINDQRQLLRKFAADICEIMERMSPLFTVLRAAAKTDPEIQALQQDILDGRLKGMEFLIGHLQRIGPLREGISPRMAAETVWVISSADVYHLLNVDHGWDKEQYIAWLGDVLGRALLP